jgi:hypothetical protein
MPTELKLTNSVDPYEYIDRTMSIEIFTWSFSSLGQEDVSVLSSGRSEKKNIYILIISQIFLKLISFITTALY